MMYHSGMPNSYSQLAPFLDNVSQGKKQELDRLARTLYADSYDSDFARDMDRWLEDNIPELHYNIGSIETLEGDDDAIALERRAIASDIGNAIRRTRSVATVSAAKLLRDIDKKGYKPTPPLRNRPNAKNYYGICALIQDACQERGEEIQQISFMDKNTTVGGTKNHSNSISKRANGYVGLHSFAIITSKLTEPMRRLWKFLEAYKTCGEEEIRQLRGDILNTCGVIFHAGECQDEVLKKLLKEVIDRIKQGDNSRRFADFLTEVYGRLQGIAWANRMPTSVSPELNPLTGEFAYVSDNEDDDNPRPRKRMKRTFFGPPTRRLQTVVSDSETESDNDADETLELHRHRGALEAS